MCSNLGAKFTEKIYATDASIEKGAILEAGIDVRINKVLHRCLRSKGAYTRMTHASQNVLETLQDEGYDAGGPERPIASRFDFLEVFAGAAKITQYVLEMTSLSCGPPLDLTYSPEYDMKLVHVLSLGYTHDLRAETGRLCS